MEIIQAAIVTFTKPYFTYDETTNIVRHYPTNVEPGNTSVTSIFLTDKYFEANTLAEVEAEFTRLGFTIPEANPWDFPELPLRLFLSDTDLLDIFALYPAMSMFIDTMKDTTVKRNKGRWVYLSEVYPEHQAMFSAYSSFVLENRPF